RGALRPAFEAMVAAGWDPGTAGRLRGGEPWPGFAEAFGHELGVGRRIGRHPVGVELHWRLVDDPRANLLDREVLARGGTELDGAIVPGAPPLLLALALHLVAHPDRRLLMVQDVALAARACGDDGRAQAVELATALGLLWELRLALAAAVDHAALAIELPPGP